jgi:hypothetical protein
MTVCKIAFCVFVLACSQVNATINGVGPSQRFAAGFAGGSTETLFFFGGELASK